MVWVGGGAGAAEGVVGGFGTGYLVATAACQNAGAAQMVAEEVEQAVVACRWVAGNAGGYGLTTQCVAGTADFGIADHEVVEVGVGIDGPETNLAAGEGGTVAVLGLEGAVDIQFGSVAVEQGFHIVPLGVGDCFIDHIQVAVAITGALNLRP